MTPAQVAHIMALVNKYATKMEMGSPDEIREARAAVEAALRDAPQQAEGWVKAVQSFADELELPFLEAKSFLDEVFPQWMADKEAAGFITLRLDDLIEGDSYGVDGSDFYRCRICHSESGAGMLNNGIKHEHDCPLAARPSAPTAVEPDERAEFEAWCALDNPRYHPTDDNPLNRRDWKVWQAARASKGTK